jgi:hypothetical protein
MALAGPDGSAITTLVVDITTMPRICFFPLLAAAIDEASLRTIIVVYAEPNGYHAGALASEPSKPTVVPPFDYLPLARKSRTRIGWIPVLGFGPFFATSVYETLVDTYDLGGRTFPLIGFPAYSPRLFERVLDESARTVVQEVRGDGLRDQFLYAAASDPFETRDTILRLIADGPPDVHWIGSPMGSKPMALGMLLAAKDNDLTVMIAQARSYNPEYSTGRKVVHAYVLRHNGRRAY